MANYRLPLDLTGTLASNRVTQTRTLNMTSKMGDKFIIPADAPFFADNLVITKVGTATPMTRGVDYELIFEYPDLFQMTQKYIYGGIKFKNRNITGQVTLVLQALGGPFLQPVQNTLETIARNKTNVNTATWGELAGVPAGFPVLNHPQTSDDFTGFGQIQSTLNDGIALLLAGTGGGTGSSDAAMALIRSHMTNPSNAHTKAAVGLGSVPNFSMATYEESDLGVNNRFTSPAIVKYLIGKYSGLTAITDIQTHLNVIDRDVGAIQQGLEQNNISVSQISQRVSGLDNSFQNVRQEFSNVLTYVNDLGSSIENIQYVVEGVRTQIEDSLRRVSDMEALVGQIRIENENINSVLSTLSEGISGLSSRTTAVEINLATAIKDIAKLNTTLLYPLRRFISAGSYNFSIKPNETRVITLVGPGGGGGIVIPTDKVGVMPGYGNRGSDTYLILNTDLSNGINTNGDVVARAEAGGGGQSSIQGANGIEHFGVGGVGGQTTYTGLFTVINNVIGAGGLNAETIVPVNHPGAAGQTIQGKKYADGGASPSLAGSGAAGAMIILSITNTYQWDLEFTAVVGEAPRNVTGNNLQPAAPGLFFIDIA